MSDTQSARAAKKVLLIATDPGALDKTIEKLRLAFPEAAIELATTAAVSAAIPSDVAVIRSFSTGGISFYLELLRWFLRRSFSGYEACTVMYATAPLLLAAVMTRGARALVCNGESQPRSLWQAFFEYATQPCRRLSEWCRLRSERFGVAWTRWWAKIVAWYRGRLRRTYHQVVDAVHEPVRYPYYVASGFIKGRGRHYRHQVYVAAKWTGNKSWSLIVGILEGTLFRFADETAGYSRGVWTRSKTSIRRIAIRLPLFLYDQAKRLVRLLAIPPAILILAVSVVSLYLHRKFSEFLHAR